MKMDKLWVLQKKNKEREVGGWWLLGACVVVKCIWDHGCQSLKITLSSLNLFESKKNYGKDEMLNLQVNILLKKIKSRLDILSKPVYLLRSITANQ